jgi:hypothetical protein
VPIEPTSISQQVPRGQVGPRQQTPVGQANFEQTVEVRPANAAADEVEAQALFFPRRQAAEGLARRHPEEPVQAEYIDTEED